MVRLLYWRSVNILDGIFCITISILQQNLAFYGMTLQRCYVVANLHFLILSPHFRLLQSWRSQNTHLHLLLLTLYISCNCSNTIWAHLLPIEALKLHEHWCQIPLQFLRNHTSPHLYLLNCYRARSCDSVRIYGASSVFEQSWNESEGWNCGKLDK